MNDSKQNQPTNDIDSKAFSEHTAEVVLPAETLFQSSGNLMPTHETQVIRRVLPSDHDSIQLSKDKLFFVKFTPVPRSSRFTRYNGHQSIDDKRR